MADKASITIENIRGSVYNIDLITYDKQDTALAYASGLARMPPRTKEGLPPVPLILHGVDLIPITGPTTSVCPKWWDGTNLSKSLMDRIDEIKRLKEENQSNEARIAALQNEVFNGKCEP